MRALLQRVGRVAAETPFEIMIALLSVYLGVVNLLYGKPSRDVPWAVFYVTVWTVAIGGVVTLTARLLPGTRMRLELSGLALLTCAFSLFTVWSLVRQGVNIYSVTGVSSDIAVALACFFRIRVLSTALHLLKEKPC